MKRLFAVFTLCATTLIAASAVSGPAAADGRHDGRRHAGQSDRQMSRVTTARGEHRRTFDQRAFGGQRDHRYKKYRHHHKRQRHARSHRHGYQYGRSYSHRRDRHRTWPGPAYAFRFDGGRFIIRLD